VGEGERERLTEESRLALPTVLDAVFDGPELAVVL
jgi:hypothetical protein